MRKVMKFTLMLAVLLMTAGQVSAESVMFKTKSQNNVPAMARSSPHLRVTSWTNSWNSTTSPSSTNSNPQLSSHTE